MYIPYALYLDGQVIKLYDAVSHQLDSRRRRERRIAGYARGATRAGCKIRRPFITRAAS